MKQGVEGGMPFDKMDKEKAEVHKKLLVDTDDDTVD